MSAAPARWRVELGLVFVAFIWGFTFVLVKAALAHISTLLFLTLRFALATIALVFIFRRSLTRFSLRSNWKGGVLAGVFLFSGYVLQTFGLRWTSPAKAGFLTGLYIPLVPLLGFIIYRQRPQFREVAGIITAFSGMAFMSIEPGQWRIQIGDILVIACAVVYALHILVLGHFAGSGNVPALTVLQIATGALVGASTFWWTEPVQASFPALVWTALAVTSLFATALAFALQTWGQKHTSPSRTALIFSMEPVFALLSSWLLTGEVLTMRAAIGAALIFGSILIVEVKLSSEPEFI